jgi:hypothetical protein
VVVREKELPDIPGPMIGGTPGTRGGAPVPGPVRGGGGIPGPAGGSFGLGRSLAGSQSRSRSLGGRFMSLSRSAGRSRSKGGWVRSRSESLSRPSTMPGPGTPGPQGPLVGFCREAMAGEGWDDGGWTCGGCGVASCDWGRRGVDELDGGGGPAAYGDPPIGGECDIGRRGWLAAGTGVE